MTKTNGTVRSLIRGLEVLRYLNRMGSARAADIAKATGIARPTVYRLLHTLEEAGYVVFSATDARVRVAPLAASLGDNSAARSKLCQIAAPVMARFTQAHGWPVDLSTYDNLHMIIQETTHHRSVFSIDRDMSGFPLPLLRSSAGRAFLANLPLNERDIILTMLHEEALLEDGPFLTREWLETNLTACRALGYASRDAHTFRPKTASIAVPIQTRIRVIGCLSIIWISTAMTVLEAAKRYQATLKKAADDIAAAYQEEKAD